MFSFMIVSIQLITLEHNAQKLQQVQVITVHKKNPHESINYPSYPTTLAANASYQSLSIDHIRERVNRSLMITQLFPVE